MFTLQLLRLLQERLTRWFLLQQKRLGLVGDNNITNFNESEMQRGWVWGKTCACTDESKICAKHMAGLNAARKESSANSFLSITLHENNRHDRDKRREARSLSLAMREDYKIIALRGAL